MLNCKCYSFQGLQNDCLHICSLLGVGFYVIFGPCLRHLDIKPAYLGIEPLQPWLLYVNIICKLTDEPELHPQVLKIFQPTRGPLAMCCSCLKQHTFSRTEPGRSMVSTGKHHGDDDSSENVTSTGAFLLEEYIQSLWSHGCAGHERAFTPSAKTFPGVPGSKIRSSGCFLKWGSTKPWVSLLKWYEMAKFR